MMYELSSDRHIERKTQPLSTRHEENLLALATSLWYVNFPQNIDVHITDEGIFDLASCLKVGQSSEGESKRPGLSPGVCLGSSWFPTFREF